MSQIPSSNKFIKNSTRAIEDKLSYAMINIINKMTGIELLRLENKARESGNSIKSLQLAEEAFKEFIHSDDLVGAARSCTVQAITLGHLADKNNNDLNYRLRSKHVALAGVEIAERSKNSESVAASLFGAGSAFYNLGEYEGASKLFKEALQVFLQLKHSKQSVIADLRVHLEISQYRAGDKSALERALGALSELEKADESRYEKDVWVSGGYMKIADATYSDYPEKSKEFLQKAKEIIDRNPELVMRKKQIQAFLKRLD